MTDLSRLFRRTLREIHDDFDRMMREGVAGKTFLRMFEGFPAVLKTIEDRMDAVRRQLAADQSAALIPEFEAVAGEVASLRRAVEDVLALASAPPPPLDMEAIRAAEEALDRGEGEDVADLVARLRAGGDIVPE